MGGNRYCAVLGDLQSGWSYWEFHIFGDQVGGSAWRAIDNDRASLIFFLFPTITKRHCSSPLLTTYSSFRFT